MEISTSEGLNREEFLVLGDLLKLRGHHGLGEDGDKFIHDRFW